MKLSPARASQMAFLFLLALFLALPLIVVIGVSFSSTAQMRFPPTGYGLRWYETFFTSYAWTNAFKNSVTIAILSSLLSVSMALPPCYVMWKYKSRLAKSLIGLGGLAFIVPPVVIAVVYLLFWGILRHVGRVENIVIGHAVTFVAMPMVMISLGFSSISDELIEAAETMGAKADAVFRTVILPIITPFVFSSLIFVAIFSLNEYLIAFMVGGFSAQTLPVKIFSDMRTGFTPAICVAAVLFLALGMIGFSIIARFGNLPKLLGARD